MKYEVIYGNGTAWVSKEIVEVDRPTTDYGAILDIAIDQMERRGETHQFVSLEDIEAEGIFEDMYVTGGNHSLNLMHYGTLDVRELN